MVEVVANFNYLGGTLDQKDDYWSSVRENIMRARTLLRKEGAESKVSAMFYRAVAQAVLLFGSETCVLSAAMEQKVEGTHTCFLCQITRKRTQRLGDGTGDTHGVEVAQEAARTQSEMTYIGIQQATVAQ